MRQVTLRCALLLLALLPFAVSAGIAVKPANMVLSLDGPRPAGRFVVANNGDAEERFRINAMHFSYSTAGALQVVPADEHSLAPWVKFNPKEFTLPPNSKRAVRFVVVPRGSLLDGEYWGAMELESLDFQEASGSDQEGRDFKIKIIPSVLVPIYGTVGNVQYNAAITDVSIVATEGGAAIRTLIENIGDGRLMMDGSFSIIDALQQQVAEGSLPRGLVLPGKQRYFTRAIGSTLGPGDYQININIGANTMGERRIVEDFAFRID